VARALGADKIIYSGKKDTKLEESVKHVVKQWGGEFSIDYAKNWKKTITDYKKQGWLIIHLTVYGLPIQNQINKIRKSGKNILVIIGGEKVLTDIYKLADMNISVTSQPHSEIAALAIFLHEYCQGRGLGKRFRNAKLRIIPQERGKRIINNTTKTHN
jgi:tRNA (cytidine56-2'-O)-methyltransferase